MRLWRYEGTSICSDDSHQLIVSDGGSAPGWVSWQTGPPRNKVLLDGIIATRAFADMPPVPKPIILRRFTDTDNRHAEDTSVSIFNGQDLDDEVCDFQDIAEV